MSKATNLTAERLTELKATAYKILTDDRRRMLDKHPFVGTVAMSLDIVPIRDSRVSTAMTDGNAIYFDIDFLSRLNNDERMFVLAHEVWHNVMLHFIRCVDGDHAVANIATDMEVNSILRDEGFIAPKSAIFPEKYMFNTGLSAEEYYDLLMAQKQVGKKHSQSNTESNDSDGENSSKKPAGNKLNGQFDQHAGTSLEEMPDMQTEDKYGNVGKDDDFRPNPSDLTAEKMRETVITAAQHVERTRGEIPVYVKSVVEKLLEPKIDWKDQLIANVSRAFYDKTTWNSPNRRFAGNGLYLPSHCGEKLRIAVGIDTSGSTNPDLPEFLAELSGIVNTFGNYELHVIQCDTEVKDYKLYNDDTPFIDSDFQFEGGGGTCLTPIFDYIAENELDIDTIIVQTDGYCETLTEDVANGIPTLFVISKDGISSNIKFGEKIVLK